MRGLTSTIVLFVILAGLGAYIYFVDNKRPAAGTETKPKAFEVAGDQIEEIEIKGADGQTTRLRKADDKWTLVQPLEADADPGEVSSLTTNLSALDIQRVVDEKPADLTTYGLSPAKVEVGFRAKGQKNFQRLLIGEKTPSGGDVYAKKPGESRVFLASSYLESTFNKTPFDLREKSILKFESDKVDGLEIRQGSSMVQFAKSGTVEWKLVKPIMARGDYGSIESIIGRLSMEKMQKLVASDVADLKKYGLDSPVAQVIISAGSTKATLAIGKTEDGMAYARDASRPMVFTVEEALLTELKKPIGDYRRKDLFDFRPFTVKVVQIVRGSEKFGIEKSVDKDGKEVWRNAGGRVVEAAKVEDALNKLSGLRAQSFEGQSHPSLKAPLLTVTAKFNEDSSETVAFGRAGSDVLAGRADEEGSAKLEAAGFDEALKALDVLK